MAEKSVLSIIYQLAKQGNADKEVLSGLKSVEKGVKTAMAAFGALAGVAVTVGAAYKYIISGAAQAEVVQAKLNSVLASTGGVAGMTKQSLDSLADGLSRVSGVDDDLIRNGEAVMLTFTKIGSDVFPDATEAALNMSLVLGQDLQGAVVQVGKALNVAAGDTSAASKAMSALTRSGVSFTSEQKKMALEMVATGDVIGYQKLILSELNTEFGKSAELMGQTNVASAERMKNAWGELVEAIGDKFLPASTDANNALADLMYTMADSVDAGNRYTDVLGQAEQAQYGLARALGMTIQQYDELGGSWGDYINQYQVALEYGAAWERALEGQAQKTAELAEVSEEASKGNTDMLSLIMDLQSENDDYNASLSELNEKMASLTAEQEKYLAGSEEYDKLQGEINETGGAIEELAEKHEMAGKRIAFSLVQAKMAVDGFSDAEFDTLLVLGEKWGILDHETVTAAQNMTREVNKLAGATANALMTVDDLHNRWAGMMKMSGQEIDLIVNMVVRGNMPVAPGGAHPGSVLATPMAEGGQLGDDWAIVGERGPEIVSPQGYVFPHDVSQHLIAAGIVPQNAFAFGGDLYGGGGGNVSSPKKTARAIIRGSSAVRGSSSNRGGSFAPSAAVGAPSAAAADSVAASVDETVAPLVQTTADALQSTQAVQQATALQLQGVLNAQTEGNLILGNIHDELKRNNATMRDAFSASVEQLRG